MRNRRANRLRLPRPGAFLGPASRNLRLSGLVRLRARVAVGGGTWFAAATALLLGGVAAAQTPPPPPQLSTAAVDAQDATVVTLTFDKDLAAVAQPDSPWRDLRLAFSADGHYGLGNPLSDVTPESVTVSDRTVTLDFGDLEARPGRAVTVRYDEPFATANLATSLQDDSGNKVASFTTTATRAATASIPPVLTTAEVDGTTLTLTFDLALDPGSRPAGNRFWLMRGVGARTSIDGAGTAAVSGTKVTVTLELAVAPSAVAEGQRMEVWYEKGDDANPLRSASSGNPEVGDIWAFQPVTVGGVATTLTASDVGETTATLTTNYAGAWWHKGDHQDATACTAVTSGTTTASLTNLSAGASYTWRAYDRQGCNSADEVARVTFTTQAATGGTPVAPGSPDAPDAPELTPGDGHLTVSWTAPADNGAAISDYDVRYRQGSSGQWTAHPHDGAETTATLTGLTNGITHQVQVRAVNAAGAGEWSPSAVATPAGAPDALDAPELTPGDGRLAVQWTAPADNGAAIAGYDVRYRQDGSGQWTVHTHGSTETATTITGLTNGIAYQVRVRAFNAVGPGAWSAGVSATPAAEPVVTFSTDNPIELDEGGSIELTLAVDPVPAGGGAATVTVTVTAAPTGAVVLSEQGLDAITVPLSGGAPTFTVTAVRDADTEDEEVTLSLSDPSGAMLGEPSTWTLAVRDAVPVPALPIAGLMGLAALLAGIAWRRSSDPRRSPLLRR